MAVGRSEDEIRCVQVGDVEVRQNDISITVPGQVNHNSVLLPFHGQVSKGMDVLKRAKVNTIIAIFSSRSVYSARKWSGNLSTFASPLRFLTCFNQLSIVYLRGIGHISAVCPFSCNMSFHLSIISICLLFSMNILVTGCAGFIGAALSRRLLERGDEVIGIDNLNDYYDPALKRDRLALLEQFGNFSFRKVDVSDAACMADLFREVAPRWVVHMAAQAGVRYSITHPHSYISANIEGFLNVLEGCRATGVEHLVYASSSSVYGANEKLPFSESDPAAHPVSLYGATKRANELMAHSYSHLYDIPASGLRYFTVYGPWGRPDMSPMLFAGKIYAGEPIQVFNRGEHSRDFTCIDDVVEATLRITNRAPDRDEDWEATRPEPASGPARCRIYNIGNQHAVNLADYVRTLEREIGRKAVLEYTGAQPGDVQDTLSDSSRLREEFGFVPGVTLEQGIKRFIEWYKGYYKVE